MQIIQLQNVPNQIFNTVLNGIDYRIQLRTIQDLTFLSVFRNGEPLFYNQLCTPNEFVDPYDYISQNGRLYFACSDNEYPNYRLFNNTQRLYCLTPEEVKEYEAS